jgi:hypothetical protein
VTSVTSGVGPPTYKAAHETFPRSQRWTEAMLSYAVDPTPSRPAGEASSAWAVVVVFFAMLALA